MDEWEKNKDEILKAYPDDFGYKNDEELAYLKDWYENQFDEFVDSVYLTRIGSRERAGVTELLRDAGLIPADQQQPMHACIDPESGEQTCCFPSRRRPGASPVESFGGRGDTELETRLRDAATLGPTALGTESGEYRRRKARRVLAARGRRAALVVWQIAIRFQRTAFELLPPPWRGGRQHVGTTSSATRLAGSRPGTVFINFWETFRKTLIGFVGAVVLGVPIGILMGRYRYAKNFFFDMVYLAANVPLIVYAILADGAVRAGRHRPGLRRRAAGPAGHRPERGRRGRGRRSAAALDEPRIRAGRPGRRCATSSWPTFLPFLFAASRASFAASWKLAALAETFGGTTGVGVQIRKAFQGFAVADMMAWMMFFVIFVVFVERVVLMRLERYVFRYRLRGMRMSSVTDVAAATPPGRG